MLYAQEKCCTFCDGSLFDFSEQENARTYKDVCVSTWFVCFEYGLYMFCVACIVFAVDAAVKCAIALLFTSKNKKCNTYKDVSVLTRLAFLFHIWIVYVLCSFL